MVGQFYQKRPAFFSDHFPRTRSLRWRMFGLIILVCLVGLFVSKALLWLGAHSLLLRYTMAIVTSYAVFYAAVRIWLGSLVPEGARFRSMKVRARRRKEL